ncbi:trophoblast Kunitz domain protein 1 [Cervus elaphus]|uniref:trophoblast Kunitz domain protein 1 n=1 Tax=Cervus elaphus TaxID=9860 RepID=UPI001CC2B0F5|nr:trophoblast Kunitz domain protein 1 [Cervus elaphus]
MRRLCLSAALLFLLVILVDSTPLNIHHIQDEGVETSHGRGPEKRSVIDVVTSIIDGVATGTKIVEKGASILTGLAEIINRAIKGQVMISRIQFDNHTLEPTLNVEYSTLTENKGVETSHRRGPEKRSVIDAVTSIIDGVATGTKIVKKGASILTGLAEIINRAIKGQVMISRIQFDNHTLEELPKLSIEYSTISEDNTGVETSHRRGLEKRSVIDVVTSIIDGVATGTKIVKKGVSILTGLAEIINKAIKGQVMISRIQFDNHTLEELPKLNIEYSTLSEDNTGVETSHRRGLEKRSVIDVVTSIIDGVATGTKIVKKGVSILTGLAEIINKAIKGQVMISRIQFDNHTLEELPKLSIEYSTLSEDNTGVETSHRRGLEKRSVIDVVTSIIDGVATGTKIVKKGVSILTGLAEIINKAIKGQVMISRIQFNNHTLEELPKLNIEYSTLSEDNTGVETSHRRGLEKRSVIDVVTSIIDGVATGTKIVKKGASILTGLAEIISKAIKGQVMISGIQFDNHTLEEYQTLKIEYSTLNEENKAASMPAFCLEPKVTGGCNTMMTRYFYNAQTGLCEQFVYGGCEGNANNFEKLEDCMKTCSQEAGSLWIFVFTSILKASSPSSPCPPSLLSLYVAKVEFPASSSQHQ